ncbi:MAG: flagellar brake protein, partial [Fimbriimonadaceae bacterium]
AAVAYVATVAQTRRVRLSPLKPGNMVRLQGPDGRYRSEYLGAHRRHLEFKAPMRQDSYVPLRPGDSYLVFVPREGAMFTFRTTILERSAADHRLKTSLPIRLHRLERRTGRRHPVPSETWVTLNGKKARLLDLSRQGAHLLYPGQLKAGDKASFHGSPPPLGEVDAWVVESDPTVVCGAPGRSLRVMFQRPLAGYGDLLK